MPDVELPPDIETRLAALVERTGRSRAFYIREALIEHLGDLEDVFLAESRLEECERGDGDTVSLAELLARYGMEH